MHRAQVRRGVHISPSSGGWLLWLYGAPGVASVFSTIEWLQCGVYVGERRVEMQYLDSLLLLKC